MTETVLVICHANVTRSVAAALLLRAELPEFDVTSGGTHAVDGEPLSARTVAALATVLPAGEVPRHRSHLVQPEDLDLADLVVTMEASQVRLLRARHPACAPRLATLAFLARELPSGPSSLRDRVVGMQLERVEPDDRDDVVDPAGGDDEAYASAVADIAALCASLVPRIRG